MKSEFIVSEERKQSVQSEHSRSDLDRRIRRTQGNAREAVSVQSACRGYTSRRSVKALRIHSETNKYFTKGDSELV
jgi:hypothetical protein